MWVELNIGQSRGRRLFPSSIDDDLEYFVSYARCNLTARRPVSPVRGIPRIVADDDSLSEREISKSVLFFEVDMEFLFSKSVNQQLVLFRLE